MIISETEIAPLRHGTDPIRIAPEYTALAPMNDFAAPAPENYADFSRTLSDARKIFQEISLLGSVTFTGTDEVFCSDWRIPHRAVPVLAFTQFVPILTRRRRWMAMEHQGGGYVCAQTLMVATRFSALPGIQTLIDDIARKLHFAINGWFQSADTDPAVTRSYEATIARYGLTLRGSGRTHLQESIYPVDADKIATLTEDAEIIQLCQVSPVSPMILFLAENSD